MKVLIACEESQEVCKAFRSLGHEAYSCDVQEPSGGHPEWHILGDAVPALRGGKSSQWTTKRITLMRGTCSLRTRHAHIFQTPEEFDMTLYEHLFDGPETIEGLLAEHYTLSWALASLRDKLKHYEDALIPEIMPEGLQTIDRAIGTYGKDAQLTKAVEEMSELTKALCKLKECKRKYDTPFNRETQEVYSNVEEETADVFIMLVQLFAIFNPHELVNITKIVWDKLDRLKDNLDKEAAKQEASDAGKK